MMSLQQFPFGELAGTQAVATIPVSDRLINELIARDIPPGGAVRQVEIEALGANRVKARITLRAGFMPSLNISAEVDQQPSLPGSPVLGLRLSGLGGLMGMAGAAAGLANVLPPGVRMEGDRVLVNVHTLMRERGLAALIPHIEEIFVTTEPGRVVFAFRLHVRGA